MTARSQHRRTAALGIAVFVAGGCAVDRLTAVELIPRVGADAGGTGIDASIDGVADGPSDGAADAPSDGAVRPSSEEDGSDGGPESSSSSCTSPVFSNSSPLAIWPKDGIPYEGYFVYNNMWNADAGLGMQTLSVCSYNSWFVVSDQTDNAGAVKTYPNVQMNFNDVPIASLNGVMSKFAETSPHVGIYDDAYDVWLNGIASASSTEIMVWVDNYNQVPNGSKVTTTTFGDRTYDVWRTSDGSYIAFVSPVPFTSGTVDLLEIFTWAIQQKWLLLTSTLDQIDFGVEIVSTGGGKATYEFNDFSITTN